MRGGGERGRENEPARKPLCSESKRREKQRSDLIGWECDIVTRQVAVSGRLLLEAKFWILVLDVCKQKLGFSIQLRKEQNVAVNCLLDGKYVLAAVLPTRLGNSQ